MMLSDCRTSFAKQSRSAHRAPGLWQSWPCASFSLRSLCWRERQHVGRWARRKGNWLRTRRRPGGSWGTSPRSATRPRRARGPRRPHREAGHAPCRAQRQEKRGAGDPLQQLGNSTRAAALSRGRGLGAQPCVAATAPAAPAGGRSRLRGSVAFVSSSVRALLCPAGRRGTETAEAGPHETRRAKSR